MEREPAPTKRVQTVDGCSNQLGYNCMAPLATLWNKPKATITTDQLQKNYEGQFLARKRKKQQKHDELSYPRKVL